MHAPTAALPPRGVERRGGEALAAEEVVVSDEGAGDGAADEARGEGPGVVGDGDGGGGGGGGGGADGGGGEEGVAGCVVVVMSGPFLLIEYPPTHPGRQAHTHAHTSP